MKDPVQAMHEYGDQQEFTVANGHATMRCKLRDRVVTVT